MKKYFCVVNSIWSLLFMLCFSTTTLDLSAAEYDFSSLGTASSGFKPQGNRFLVSEKFTQDGTMMYYDHSGLSATGADRAIIKPNGTDLVSFDLDDMGFSPYEDNRQLTLTIEADTITGVESRTVSNYYMSYPGAYTLKGMGMDTSVFNDVTELRIAMTLTAVPDATTHDVYCINFETITILDEKTVASGTLPTIQASGLTTASTDVNQVNIYWQNGNGSRRLVFAKQGGSGTPSIANGVQYTANPNFGAGTDIGGGWKCVHSGTENFVGITGLSENIIYRFVVYEYDGTGGGEVYLTTTDSNIINQSTASSSVDRRDFSGLGADDGTFKPQGNRYLVDNSFENDVTVMYYDQSVVSATGIIIKPDSTHLKSFDLVDMELSAYDADRQFTLTITGNLKGGGTAGPQTISDFTMLNSGFPYSLARIGMDFGAFDDVTELQLDLSSGSGNINNISFENITITDPDEFVSGTLPTVQASNLTITSIGKVSMDMLWTNGNGSSRLVFVKEGNSGEPTVVDTTIYQDNSDFSAADDIGGGWKCVYKGIHDYVTITGLTVNTEYRVVVYEFDGSGGGEIYLTAIGTNINNQSTRPSTVDIYDFSGLGTASDGFKPQGSRFLVSDLFKNDPPLTCMYYDSSDAAVNGMVIKADDTNLASFDLVDLELMPYSNGADREISVEIEADLKVGGPVSQTVSNVVMSGDGLTYSLQLMGMDFSAFDDVTELRINLTTIPIPPTTSVSVNSINFEYITLADQQVPGVPPTVTTQAVTGINATSATGHGDVTHLGNSDLIARGVVWNTTGSPTLTDSSTNEGAASSTGTFSTDMTGLSPYVTYYVRAYATNDAGTAYGNEVSMTTLAAAPSVTTQSVTAVTATTATGNATITDLGVPNPTAHGIAWATLTNPTIGDNHTDAGATGTTGAYTGMLTGLSAHTLYYVRAYATNEAGTSYGGEVSFTTSSVQSTVTTQAVTAITDVTATGHGNLTDPGVPNPTAHGIVWATHVDPTTDDGFTNAGAATTTTPFTGEITGLSPYTTYYVRAYATNAGGTVYGNEVSFLTNPASPAVVTQSADNITPTSVTGIGSITYLGTPSPTAHGMVWNETGNPDQSDNVIDLGATGVGGVYPCDITGLTPYTTYYIRAYAGNIGGTTYGNVVTFITSPVQPQVGALEVSDITSVSIIGIGDITGLGVPEPAAHGFVWNTTGTPTLMDSSVDMGAADATGTYEYEITGLLPNTVYHIRGYATNAEGTVYGEEISFTTTAAGEDESGDSSGGDFNLPKYAGGGCFIRAASGTN
ncbi:MAG: hypothetical protein HKM93_18545 [Desulfobacteraceae bacterium]|nr:hypothetical protein [Desulfobacteraceae bacterium]